MYHCLILPYNEQWRRYQTEPAHGGLYAKSSGAASNDLEDDTSSKNLGFGKGHKKGGTWELGTAGR